MKNYKFCPYCGSKSIKHLEYFECESCRKKVFMNSLPSVSAFLIRNGKYALCKRAIEPQKGKYDFIGGFVKSGEKPEQGLHREIKEETGLKVKIISLLGIYFDKYEYQGDILDIINFVYITEIVSGNITPKDDAAAIDWFNFDKIPDNLGFNSIKDAVKDLQKWKKIH